MGKVVRTQPKKGKPVVNVIQNKVIKKKDSKASTKRISAPERPQQVTPTKRRAMTPKQLIRKSPRATDDQSAKAYIKPVKASSERNNVTSPTSSYGEATVTRIMPGMINSKSKYIVVRDATTHRQVVHGRLLKILKILQNSTNFLIPKSSFAKVVREISQQFGSVRFEARALEALQIQTEDFLTTYLSVSHMLTLHRERITLGRKDMIMLRTLLRTENPNYLS